MNKTSRFTLTTWGNYSDLRGSGIIYAKFRNDSTATITGKIRFVLTEDSLYYAAPNLDNWHNHVARDYLPDTGGTQITLAPGDSITVSRSFTVQASWNANKCEIVTWLQSNVYLADSTRDVWQGGITKVSDLLVDVEENASNTVKPKVALVPNPCVDGTRFMFNLPTGTSYSITLYDISGRQVKTLKGTANGNNESMNWDLRDRDGVLVNSGVYFYRFTSSAVNLTGKIVVK